MRNGEFALPLEFLCDRSLAVALERSLPVAHGGDRQRSWRVDNVDAESSNPSYGGHMHHRDVRKVQGSLRPRCSRSFPSLLRCLD